MILNNIDISLKIFFICNAEQNPSADILLQKPTNDTIY